MGSAAKKPTVLVVDDHEVVRLGVAHVLTGQAELAQAASVAQAVDWLRRQPCDLLLLDLSLGEDFGLTALPRLRALCPTMKVLVLSSMPEDLYAERVLRAGADGFVSKGELAGTLQQAMRSVLAGQLHASAAVQHALLRRVQSGPVDDTRVSLSPRELEVLRLVAAGRSTREIAEVLNRSVKTIETHKQALKTKLGAESPTQLVRLAVNWFDEASG